MNVLLLGPQGSGKGTQAKRIASEYGVPHVATGDMIRAAIAGGSELGGRVREIYDRGDLVPDDVMVELIRERLARDDAAEGFVLDGFPRTLPQAEALDDLLAELGRELTIVLELQVSDEEALARIGRRARDEGRSDDTPEAVRRRLETYHRETEPVIAHYRARSNLVGIHGERGVDAVFAEVQDAIEQAAARA